MPSVNPPAPFSDQAPVIKFSASGIPSATKPGSVSNPLFYSPQFLSQAEDFSIPGVPKPFPGIQNPPAKPPPETAVIYFSDDERPNRLLAKDVAIRATGVPAIKLRASPPPTPAESARIKQLIANLGQIEPAVLERLVGGAYGIPGLGAVLGVEGPARDLVQLGPNALPLLLAALDDPTPTKLLIGSKLDFNWQHLESVDRIIGNPANAAEWVVLASASAQPSSQVAPPAWKRRHVVTIGDVCFGLIGQIVGRSYRVADYTDGQAGLTRIASPTDSPELARQVRAIWAAPDPSQHLLDSLLIDLFTTVELPRDNTRPISSEVRAAMWYYPAAAVVRLGTYFPVETGDAVARARAERAERAEPGI